MTPEMATAIWQAIEAAWRRDEAKLEAAIGDMLLAMRAEDREAFRDHAFAQTQLEAAQ